MLAIYKKELRIYFHTMIGFAFIAFIVFLVSMFFCLYNLTAGNASFSTSLSGVSFVFFIVMPILTMRIMAEEKRQKTDQMLYTAPVRITGIVLGKFFAMVTILLIPAILFLVYPLILSLYGKSGRSMTADYIAILGFVLFGAMYLAIGLFISTLTESQVIAAVLTFVLLLFTYFIELILIQIPGTAAASLVGFSAFVILAGMILYYLTKHVVAAAVAGCLLEIILVVLYFVKRTWFEGGITTVLNVLNCSGRLKNFYAGVLDLNEILYFISGCAIFIFLTVQAIQKKRYS
ncbi:MAG: ABC transporter permease [Lachnospiraceae bacterium]|nr:ABC transporter permease [Lachnospiraceae bacterium]